MVSACAQDGLTDAFDNLHMGMTAENVAREWEITREEQDRFSLESQLKCQRATENGEFQGMTPCILYRKYSMHDHLFHDLWVVL